MTMKEAHDILAAAKDRNALKAVLHTHFGFSVDAARAQAKLWFDAPAAPEERELKRADIARTFRDDRLTRGSRWLFINGNCIESARRRWSAGEDGPLNAIMDRLTQEIVNDLDAAKTLDELEAKLVRLDWPEDDIAYYLERFGELIPKS